MPELPEVETVAQQLRQRFIGQKVRGLWCNWPRMATPEPRKISRAVIGRTITAIGRRAKFIVIRLDDGAGLLIHLRMSGRMEFPDSGEQPHPHVHFVLRFERGPEMHFNDARKFGRVVWTRDTDAAFSKLGPEPLEDAFTSEWLLSRLKSRSRMIKPALLDQSFLAGLGNIYTDEALFRAGIHPQRRTDSLRRDDAERLHDAIREVLEQGIRSNGASIDWVYPGGSMQDNFCVYGRTGQECRRCRTMIQRLVIGQRGTHICPKCQSAPRMRRNAVGKIAKRSL